MKRNLVILCVILMVNIIFTQYMVHQYFYEHYTNSIIAALINVVLFPIALLVYKYDKKKMRGLEDR
ncbi:hypothetical protein [Bacillus sp. EB600]|uniref:hypothetical protein n=1 Tax=Bacillus sp. EB600 TaxID=2806345 RepID=UPI00210E8FB1|nr:hypothetical protein [Bacillus sp. EB600]MCQ6281496.1 hypothetical protein [Bacillus sp. EB600]